MIVRSHLPWPLRWAAFALMLGFSAAIALWAFEFGKGIAGLDGNARDELARLRSDNARLVQELDAARKVADTAESLVKSERAAQQRLAQQVHELAAEKQALQDDLGFFERLMPVSEQGVQLRGFRARAVSPGQLRYQILVMQSGREASVFSGRYELVLAGSLEGRPWQRALADGPLQFKQYARLEGTVEHPAEVVLKSVQARVLDAQGTVRAAQTARL